jgi:hypothetical protein
MKQMSLVLVLGTLAAGFIALLALRRGCSTEPATYEKHPAPIPYGFAKSNNNLPLISKAAALEIARCVVSTNTGWNEVEIDRVYRHEHTWVIRFFRRPYMAGGHATIHVSEDGTLIKLYYGY